MKPYLIALTLSLASPACAEECTRFMHNYAGSTFQFFGPGAILEKTVLVFDERGPEQKPAIFIRTVCRFPGYTCFRNIDDQSDTVEWRYVLGEDFDGKPAHVFVEDADRAGLAWTPACDVLDEMAREDAKSQPLVLPLPR